jgi:hypothetical protein
VTPGCNQAESYNEGYGSKKGCFSSDDYDGGGDQFWKYTVVIPVVPQPGAECEGDTGDRNIRDTWPAMLRGRGHHVEPLHAPQISETLTQVCA